MPSPLHSWRRPALAAACCALVAGAWGGAAGGAGAGALGCETPYPGGGTPRQELAPAAIAGLNRLRADNGLAPVRPVASLQRAALWKSGHMIAGRYYDHADLPSGRTVDSRSAECGFDGSYVGENIVYGRDTPEAALAAWAGSSGHRDNMLNPKYTGVGLGVAQRADGVLFWTMVLGVPASPGAEPLPAAKADTLVLAEDAAERTVAVLANDDADAADPLRLTAVEGARIGSVTLTPDGSVRYRPARNRWGRERMVYTAVSRLGLPVRGALTVRVRPRNDAPIARDDSVSLGRRRVRIRHRVLANDTNLDRDRLRPVIVARPRHGVARVVGRSIVYSTRRRGRFRDALRYVAVDPFGARAVATLRIRRR